jgi:uncharacterized membrane protein
MAARRGLKLFGHPVHPMLVHLPMGLLFMVPLWDLLGLLRPTAAAASSTVATWTLAAGCLGGLGAAVAGLVDFAAIPTGHPAERAASFHLYLILGALCLYATSLLVRHGQPAVASRGLFALDGAGFLLLVAGGFFGAEVVYRHGVGRDDDETYAPKPTATSIIRRVSDVEHRSDQPDPSRAAR